MKGFGIDIRNELLDQKHIEKMGVSVWFFMWCLDKITSINEQGIGKILGGKPIKYEEIKKELGISERTYRRWVETLKEEGYINTKQAPYGLVITVNKAKKAWAKRSATSAMRSAISDTSIGYAVSGTSDGESGTSNKTIAVDNSSIDNSKDLPDSVGMKKADEFIKLFEKINPSYRQWYKRVPYKNSLIRIIKIHGEEKIRWVIGVLPKTNTMQYAPRITTPIQLEEKLADLVYFLKSRKEVKQDYVKVN